MGRGGCMGRFQIDDLDAEIVQLPYLFPVCTDCPILPFQLSIKKSPLQTGAVKYMLSEYVISPRMQIMICDSHLNFFSFPEIVTQFISTPVFIWIQKRDHVSIIS